jgi:acyl carrier protein
MSGKLIGWRRENWSLLDHESLKECCGIRVARDFNSSGQRPAMDVLNDVKLIISKQVGIPSDHLSPQSRLEVIGVESLDIIEIVFALEEKYKIAIPFEANDSTHLAFDTIGQVAEAVQKLLGPKHSS